MKIRKINYRKIAIFTTLYLIIFAAFISVNVSEDRYIQNNFEIENGERVWFADEQIIGHFIRVSNGEEIIHDKLGEHVLVQDTIVFLTRNWDRMYITVGDQVYIRQNKEEKIKTEIEDRQYTIQWKQDSDEFWINKYREYYYIEVDGWSLGIFNHCTNFGSARKLLCSTIKPRYTFGLSKKQEKFYVYIFTPENEDDMTEVILVNGKIENKLRSGNASETSREEIEQIAGTTSGSYIYKTTHKCQCEQYDKFCGSTLNVVDDELGITYNGWHVLYITPELSVPIRYRILNITIKFLFIMLFIITVLYSMWKIAESYG